MNGFCLICTHVIQLYALRGLKRGSSSSINHHHQATNNGKTPPSSSSSASSSSLATANSADPMGNNYRPVQPTHHRAVRTNIDFTGSSSPTSFQVCSSSFDSIPRSRFPLLHPFLSSRPLFIASPNLLFYDVESIRFSSVFHILPSLIF